MASISQFKSSLLGGGARPDKFQVSLQFPVWVTAGTNVAQQASFLCKAAELPASTLGNIAVNYMGQPINFAGERTYAPWAVTIYNDASFNIRQALEFWQSGIVQYGDTSGSHGSSPDDYQTQMAVNQLDRAGNPIMGYIFTNAYPGDIQAITLDFDTVNSIESFVCSFIYDYFTPVPGGVQGLAVSAPSVGVQVAATGSFPLPV